MSTGLLINHGGRIYRLTKQNYRLFLEDGARSFGCVDPNRYGVFLGQLEADTWTWDERHFLDALRSEKTTNNAAKRIAAGPVAIENIPWGTECEECSGTGKTQATCTECHKGLTLADEKRDPETNLCGQCELDELDEEERRRA